MQLNILGMCSSGLEINFKGKTWRAQHLLVVDNLPVPFHLCSRHSEDLKAIGATAAVQPFTRELQPFTREYVPESYRDHTYWTAKRSFVMPVPRARQSCRRWRWPKAEPNLWYLPRAIASVASSNQSLE